MTQIIVGGTSPAGLRWPHYVNGRVLTAEDLVAEQLAVLIRDGWLGLALGSGVAQGLEVTGSPGSSVLTVSPGTGVPPGGTAIHLDAPASLDLTVVSSPTPADRSMFSDCPSQAPTTRTPGAGAYLLSMSPSIGYEGKVPLRGSLNAKLPTPCTSRSEAEGVVFSATRLDGFTGGSTPANRRNLLAHWCFGSASLPELVMSAFTSPLPYRGLDTLTDLSSGSLPLAVFDWDGAALAFVDMWSARRRPVRPSAAVALAEVVSDHLCGDGEARFLQFQAELAELLISPAAASTVAVESFPWLPPAALLPIAPVAAFSWLQSRVDDPTGWLADLLEVLEATSGDGVDPARFFAGLTVRVGVVDQESVGPTIRRSWCDEPIVVTKGGLLDASFVVSSDDKSVAPYLLLTKRQRDIRWVETKDGDVG